MYFKWTTKDMEKAFGAIEGGAWALIMQEGYIVCQRAPYSQTHEKNQQIYKWTQPLS